MAVPVDGTGTASVAPVKAPPVPGMQKPPRRVGKRFHDRLVVAPEVKVKQPAGLKTRPAWLPRFFAGGGIVMMLSSRFLLAPPYSLSIIEADPAEDVYSNYVSNSLATQAKACW
jgi:hypothetical protein